MNGVTRAQEDVPRIFYSVWTAAEYGDEACVRGHIESRGLSLNATDGHGYTALHLAAQHDHIAIVRYLLERGACVDGPRESACTPLHRAAFAGALESCQALVASGADLEAVDTSFGDGRRPLHKACRHVAVVRLLIQAGADVDSRDGRHRTPLHVAAEIGAAEVVSLLLAKGARREARDADGLAPAHLAAIAGHALQDVLDSDDLVDASGRRPIDLLNRDDAVVDDTPRLRAEPQPRDPVAVVVAPSRRKLRAESRPPRTVPDKSRGRCPFPPIRSLFPTTTPRPSPTPFFGPSVPRINVGSPKRRRSSRPGATPLRGNFSLSLSLS